MLLLSPLGVRNGPSFENNLNPLHSKCSVSRLVKLAQWFWRRWLNVVNVFSLSLLSHLGKGHISSFGQTGIHLT